MKKRMLAAMLTAVLCLSIAGAPLAGAANLSNSTAQSYLNAIEAQPGASSYLVDFDGDGSEELLLVQWQTEEKGSYAVYSGSQCITSQTVEYQDLELNQKSGTSGRYICISPMYGDADGLTSYTLSGGKWVKVDDLSSVWIGMTQKCYINGKAASAEEYQRAVKEYRSICDLNGFSSWHSAYSDIVKSVNTSNSDYKDVLYSQSSSERDKLFNELLDSVIYCTNVYDYRTTLDEDLFDLLKDMQMFTDFPFAPYRENYSWGIHTVFSKENFTKLTNSVFNRTIDYRKISRTVLPSDSYEEVSFMYGDKIYLNLVDGGPGELSDSHIEQQHLYALGGNRYAAVVKQQQREWPDGDWYYASVNYAVVRKNTDGSWTLLKLYKNGYVPTTAELNAFVQPSTWAKSEVEAAEAAGLIPALTGDPSWQDNANRLQFAQLAVRLAETASGKTLPAAPTSTFTDCKDEAVRKAYAAGIVSGTSATTFSPNDPLTREQLATMLWRTVSYVQKETGRTALTAGGSLTGFTDAGKVSSWAKEAVTALAKNNIMKGTSATTLSPKNPCTVEQSILLCYRVYQAAL